jgi:hypothetical protein
MTAQKGILDCIYSSTCEVCPGKGKFIAVHLRSGRVIEVRDVAGVRLELGKLVIARSEGPPLTFLRKDVYYAGCGQGLPPFLS